MSSSRIDPEPFRVALAKAQAELDSTRSQVRTMVATWHEARSELQEAESKVAYWNTQLARQKTLSERGIVSSSKFEEVENNATAAVDRVAVMRKKVERVASPAWSATRTRPVDEHPMVREKHGRARAAPSSTWPAPSSARRCRARPSTCGCRRASRSRRRPRCLPLVAESRPWVEANFKETELTHVRKGLAATVVLDIYPDVVWQAEVESISPATGAEFALLPPQNASGNWVKVVQRLPVQGPPAAAAWRAAAARRDDRHGQDRHGPRAQPGPSIRRLDRGRHGALTALISPPLPRGGCLFQLTG